MDPGTQSRRDGDYNVFAKAAVCLTLFLIPTSSSASVTSVVPSDDVYNTTRHRSCPAQCQCEKWDDGVSVLCAFNERPVNTTGNLSLAEDDPINPLAGFDFAEWSLVDRLEVSGVSLSCLNFSLLSAVQSITYTAGGDGNLTACSSSPLHLRDLARLSVRNVSDLVSSSMFPLDGRFGSVGRLDLSSNGIGDLAGLCGPVGADITSLDLSSNRLVNTSGTTLSCLTSLGTLDLSHNLLEIWDVSLPHPGNLSHLNLSSNLLTSLHPEGFSSFTQLRELDLSFNHIEVIESATFSCHLHNLQSLTLAGNRIILLQRAAFTGLESLQWLNLSSNQLDSVSGDPFIHMAQGDCDSAGQSVNVTYTPEDISSWINFDVIDLSSNNITTVHKSLFQSALTNSRSILLSHNRLEHFPRYGLEMLPRLETLMLDDNLLFWLDVGTFTSRSLKHINLAHNKLKKIISMTFLFLPDIQVVDLSHNELNYIYKVAFYKSCKHNQHFKVDLSHNYLTEDVTWAIVTSFRHLTATECVVDLVVRNNRLRTILGDSREVYERHLQLMDVEYFYVWDHVTLDIRDNPLHCDCRLMNEVSLLSQTRKMFDGSNVTNLHHLDFWNGAYCQTPRDKRNRTVDAVAETSLCASLLRCPYECDCYFENITIVNCTKRNLVAIPYDLPPGEKKLLLSDNYIMELEDGTYLDNVTYLDISSNALISIDQEVFYRFAQPLTLYLHRNSLSEIPNSITHIENASVITLRDNPLSCDCENWWFVDWAMNHSDVIQDYDNMTCDSLKHVEELDKVVVLSACRTAPEPQGRSVTVLYAALAATITIGFLALFLVTIFIQSRRRILPVLMNRLSWYKLNLDDRSRAAKDELLLWYSPLDEDWVNHNLVELLRAQLPLHQLCPYHQCLVHPEDQHEPETQTCLQKTVSSAKAAVVVLSENFMATEWPAFEEWQGAHAGDWQVTSRSAEWTSAKSAGEWQGAQKTAHSDDCPNAQTPPNSKGLLALQTPMFFLSIETTKLSENSAICALIDAHSYHEVTEPLWVESLLDSISGSVAGVRGDHGHQLLGDRGHQLLGDRGHQLLVEEEGSSRDEAEWTDDETSSFHADEKY